MPIPLLPSLNAINKIAITKSGEWVSESQNTLANLVDDLKVAANAQSDINSIPDLWARPAMYEMVLFDDKHHLHNRFLQEWRGIMAMMALRQLRNLSELKLTSVTVPFFNKLTGREPEFLKVIAKLIPEDYIKYAQDKTLDGEKAAKLQVLIFGGKPLAVLWPSILLCPAVGLAGSFNQKRVSWWGASGIGDPIVFLSDSEKELLHGWLHNIINQLPVDKTRNKLNQLIGLLSEFRDALQVKSSVTSISSGVGLGITGFCELIDHPVAVSVDNSFLEKSNVRLINRKHITDKSLLVLSRDLYKQWNVSASDIIVGGYVTLDAVLPQATNVYLNPKMLNDINLDTYKAEVRMAEDFFTDKIGVVYTGIKAFPRALNNEVYAYGNGTKVNIILPLKRELLDYLDGEYLASHVRMVINGNDIAVELQLPLSGMQNQEQFLVVKKVYKAAHKEIVFYDGMPNVQVWPNFIVDDPQKWHVYYSYYDCSALQSFYVQPAWSDFECRELQKTSKSEIVKGGSFPEAYVCYALSAKASGESKEDLGLILLSKPEVIYTAATNKSCKIGVDFGTTNTVAYASFDGQDPTILRFEDRLYSVTVDTEEGLGTGNRDTLRRDFLTPCQQPNQDSYFIRSMFHSYRGKFTGRIDQPFFLGNIYYLDASDNIIQDKKDDNSLLNDIYADNMKWDQTSGVQVMQGFLMQFCLQCLAEAVAAGASSVDWLYSYPSAFSKEQIRKYKGIWSSQVFNELRTVSSLMLNPPEAKTEGVSMAEFFSDNMNAAINRGIVCLDIGGGSTDIAVWQGNNDQKRMQASLKFAGRNILNEYLWKKKKMGHPVLVELKNNVPEFNDLIDGLYQIKNQHEFDLQLEAFLKYYEKDIFNSLISKSIMPQLSLMVRDISFALAGIFFYCGILVGHLRRTGNYTEKEKLPNCYVGGNGSKLLDWVSDGHYTSDGDINIVFWAALMRGVCAGEPDAQFIEQLEVNKTVRPKQEVAYGLVCNYNIRNTEAPVRKSIFRPQKDIEVESIVAGEKFKVNNTLANSDLLTAQNIVDVVQIDNECRFFKNFLEGFNSDIKQCGYASVNFDRNAYSNICDLVNQKLANKSKDAQGQADKVALEPLFILMLKEALIYLAEH